jgi:hypothetical protein
VKFLKEVNRLLNEEKKFIKYQKWPDGAISVTHRVWCKHPNVSMG